MLSRLVSPHRNLDGEGLRRRNNRSKHANQVVPMGTTSPRSHTDRNFALDTPSLCPVVITYGAWSVVNASATTVLP